MNATAQVTMAFYHWRKNIPEHPYIQGLTFIFPGSMGCESFSGVIFMHTLTYAPFDGWFISTRPIDDIFDTERDLLVSVKPDRS